jgi:hypothetical protein
MAAAMIRSAQRRCVTIPIFCIGLSGSRQTFS